MLMDVRYEEIRSLEAWRAAFAEFIATFLFIFLGAGSVVVTGTLADGALTTERLVAIAQKHPSVSRIDGRGLHWTVEFHGPHWKDWTAATRETPIASKVVAAAAAQNVSIGTSGEQTSLFLAPALTISDSELDHLLQVLDHALTAADEEYARTAG